MDAFPPKPATQESPPSTNRALAGLFIFVAVFFLLFDQDLRLLAVLLGVLAIHEMGHFIALRHFGLSDSGMFFIPLIGALVRGEKKEVSQKEWTIVILAGPIPGIAFGLLLYGLANELEIPNLILPASIFLVLNLCNLLPFSPMDGGKLVETLYQPRNQLIQALFLLLACSGLITAAIFTQNYVLLLIPFLLIMGLSARMRIQKIRNKLRQNGIDYRLGYEDLSDESYWLIRDEVLRQLPIFVDAEIGEHRPLEQEDRMVNQVKAVLQKAIKADLSPVKRLLVILSWTLLGIGSLLVLYFWQAWI